MAVIANGSSAHDPINYFNAAVIFSCKFAILWLIFLEHMFKDTENRSLAYSVG